MRTKPRKFYNRMFRKMYPKPFAMSLCSRKRKLVYAKIHKLFLIEKTYQFLIEEIDKFRKSNSSKISNS